MYDRCNVTWQQIKYSKFLTFRINMGSGFGSDVFNGFFWLLVLILVSWWIAAICFFPFLVFSVLTPCIRGFKNVYELLLAGIMFPHKCSDNMINRRSYDSFWDYKDKTGNLKLKIWYIHQIILKWLFCFSFGSGDEIIKDKYLLENCLS